MKKQVGDDTMEDGMNKSINEVSGSDLTSDCIDCRKKIDGTLDYTPVPLAMKNLWLFKNGGERNEVC